MEIDASEEKVTIDFSNPPLSYSYDENGIFTQTETCSPDPLESEIKGEAVWLIPVNATLIEPPAAVENHVRMFKDSVWAQVEDNRGTKYWLPGDTWQTEPREMKDLGPLPTGAVTIPPQPTSEELATQAVAVAMAQSRSILMARMQADMVQTGAFAAAEFATFAKAGLFADWAAGQTYAKGYRLAHKGIVYEVMQEMTSLENQPPDAAGMLAVYRPLSVDQEPGDEPDGSREHPYAFIYGMDVSKDSYYTYEDKLWLAKSDMPACVWVPGTAGLWQWEEVKNEAVYTPKV